MEASEKERQEIARLCREGKVHVQEPAALDSLLEAVNAGKEPDWTVTKAEAYSDYRPLAMRWSTKSAGFGDITFYFDEGKLHCDSEGLSKDFVMKVLAKLVDTAIFDK